MAKLPGLKVHFVGPMRGLPDWNYPAFLAVERAWKQLHKQDKTTNPARNYDGKKDLPFQVYMQRSLEQTLAASAIVLLPGYEGSEGASYEINAAHAAGKVFLEAYQTDGADGERVWMFRYIESPVTNSAPAKVREFDSGAKRDVDDGKLDYEGFLSPLALRRYAEYMHENRTMKDGSVRSSDNWQKGIPLEAYMKSLLRHVMEAWTGYRQDYQDEEVVKSLCGVLFNAFGYIHEVETGHAEPLAQWERDLLAANDGQSVAP